jgi:hyperosmotically inducible periplasmic protein
MSHTCLRQLIRSTTLVGIFTCATSAFAFAQAPKADNTTVNTRDREPGAVTADQQKNDVSDRQASQKIRQSLVHDKGLSTYAHNVKIVTRDGRVTLKGPVRSETEKQAVEAKAIEVVGTGHVVNELSVALGKSTRQ